jgi:hypothetical protein
MDILRRAVFSFLTAALLACNLQAQQKPKSASPQPAVTAPDQGVVANGVYSNSTFGFKYKLPFGWVDRTQEMTDDANDLKKSILLLAVFEHPPEATGETVNSAVVVAAEAVSSYPGLRNAEQYFGPLTELVKSKRLSVVNPPYEYPLGAKQLVRGDFTKPLGSLVMHQSTLVMMGKGYVISFTFIGGSDDEVDQLVDGLSFGRKATPAPPK